MVALFPALPSRRRCDNTPEAKQETVQRVVSPEAPSRGLTSAYGLRGTAGVTALVMQAGERYWDHGERFGAEGGSS